MSYSKQKLYALGEPFGDSCTRREGGRIIYGGGGSGGGNSGVKYDNLEKLYGTQQQAAGFMLDQAMSGIPGSLGNSQEMVSEAMDGTLANRARNQAGVDAAAAFGRSMSDVNANLQRYGATMNPNAMAAQANQAALDNASLRTSSMNKATQWAEDQKWNRNAGLYGQLSGMSTGAMQGMSSAGAGLGNIAAQQNQNAAANAHGFGQFGAAMANGYVKAKDGGLIGRRGGKGLLIGKYAARLAGGGNAWEAYKQANPVGVSSGNGRRGGGYGQAVMQVLGGAAPQLLGAGLKDVMKGNKSSILKAGKSAYDSLKAAPQLLNGAQNMTQAAEFANAAQASMDAGYTGAEALGMVAQGADYASSAQAALDAAEFADTASTASTAADTASAASTAADTASAAASAADAASTASSAASWIGDGASFASIFAMANGGMVKKKGRGLRLAMGGLSNPIAKNGVDDMDSGAQMRMPSVAKMDDKAGGLPSQAQQAAIDTRYIGKTTGMGETSAGDPDGFGKEHGDYRHAVGKGVMSYFIPAGGLLAEVVHPVMEPLTRGMVTTGDKAGGVSGAILMDPIGTSASGKYKPEDIAKGNLAIAAGVPWAGKFFAEGGDVEPQQRVDFKPGGDVQGPGTETSDDIPAWLSAGEIVENAEAVKLAGKDALLAINQAGRDVREGNASPQEAQREIGQVMLERGKQLTGSLEHGIKQVANRAGARRGMGLKRGGCVPKLAGGGLLGGNLGIALGAGVNQWNRQQALDMQQQQVDLQKAASERADQQAVRADQEFQWKTTDRKRTDDLHAALGDIERKAALGDTDAYMTGKEEEAKAAAALQGVDYQPLTEEQRKVIASTPGLARMTPHMRYEMDMARAAALRKAGDFKTGEAYADKATAQATGDFMRSLMSGDYRTAGKLYNIYPNGHTIEGMDAGDDEDSVTVLDRGERKKVSRYDLMTGALAQMDPKAAANLMAQDKKLDANLQRLREQNEARLGQIAARATAGGGGRASSSKSGGKGEDDPTMSLLDRKKFNEAMGFKDEEGATADKAYSFYTQLAAAGRRNGDISAATNAELLRLSRDMATGSKKPAVDFDGNTLGFAHGVRDEAGNFRPLKSTGVRGDSIDTTTGQPFFDAKTIRSKELAGLDAFSKRDPQGYTQAAKLAQAKTEKELRDLSEIPQYSRYANAALMMQRYANEAPTQKPTVRDVDQKPAEQKPMQPGGTFAERQAGYVDRAKKADADPDLIGLQDGARKLLRQGRAADANIALEQYKKLKQERYGL